MSRLPVLPVGGSSQSPPLTASDSIEQTIAARDYSGNVAFVTLGCAKNVVDSEVMLGAFVQRGFRPTSDPANAEVIVVNTCAFLQSAVEEGIDRVLEMARYKREGRCRKLIVAGCMVERYRAELAKNFPEVDRFVSTDELLKVADDEQSPIALDEVRRPYFLYDETMPRVLSTAQHTAYVKVSEGCNRPCTFCIIPKIRGTFRSRPIESVLGEAKMLVGGGVRELNLVAQDLTSYGSDFEGNRGIRSELHTLLESLGALTKNKTREQTDFWVRLLYAYPIGTDERLIRVMQESPVVARYLDMPLQHISHGVLKQMRRPLGERGTRELIEKLRSIAPEIALRTTFIVGFPGETEEDVASLESFVREGHFTHVGVFTYSDEEEAASFAFEGRVAPEEKEDRKRRIMEAQFATLEPKLRAKVGTSERVLIEGAHEDTDLLLTARTEWQAPETDGIVIINEVDLQNGESEPTESLSGRFGRVEFTEVAGYDLVGTLTEIE